MHIRIAQTIEERFSDQAVSQPEILFLRAYSSLAGIIFDLPHAAEKARTKISAAGLETRCHAIGGDFFNEVPAGADAYICQRRQHAGMYRWPAALRGILKHVIHDWNDDRATAILRNVHRAMPPQASLLIAEGVYPPRVDQSDIARGAAEFRSLLTGAGFNLTRIIPTPARLSIIEGKFISDGPASAFVISLSH